MTDILESEAVGFTRAARSRRFTEGNLGAS